MSAGATMGVTGNAQLLLGVIAGRVVFDEEGMYRLVSVDAAAGTQVVQHRLTENTYRISVEQLSGTE